MNLARIRKNNCQGRHEKARLIVTTHVVRLKLFRLKAEWVRKERSPYSGGEKADFRIKTWLQSAQYSRFS